MLKSFITYGYPDPRFSAGNAVKAAGNPVTVNEVATARVVAATEPTAAASTSTRVLRDRITSLPTEAWQKIADKPDRFPRLAGQLGGLSFI